MAQIGQIQSLLSIVLYLQHSMRLRQQLSLQHTDNDKSGQRAGDVHVLGFVDVNRRVTHRHVTSGFDTRHSNGHWRGFSVCQRP
jgi:hypothetical protein